jgi:hypothetical protein
MWEARMGAFLHGKGRFLSDVAVNINPTTLEATEANKDKFKANAKAVDYLFWFFHSMNSILSWEKFGLSNLGKVDSCSRW